SGHGDPHDDDEREGERRSREQQHHELPAGTVDRDAATDEQPQRQHRDRPILRVVERSPQPHAHQTTRGLVKNGWMIELRTPAEIDAVRAAGGFVASVLTELAAASEVGVNLLELDALAHRLIRERGAESCYIDYHPSFGASPFGKVLCTSVNDAALHGLPFDYRLQDGDLLSLDFAASVDGWVSDSAVSFV